MKAQYTVKIGDRFYRAGEELPALDVKAEETPKAAEVIDEPKEEVVKETVIEEKPKPKRTYKRK